jgi:hypothetical protein
MQVVLETDEAWSLMSVITAYIIDHSGISQQGKQGVRRWRSDRTVGTVEMDDLAVAMNEALGTLLDEKTARMIRRRGRYISTRDLREAAP